MTAQLTTEIVLTRGVAEVLPTKNTLAELMATRPIKVYMGIDPTGSLLTLGHSVGLRKLQQFAELGHEVYLLIGNGTVKIGDPTGRDSTRPMLTDAEIEANFQNWQAQAAKILDFSKIKVVRNGDWLDKLTYTDMVKLMAQTTVQQLIERDMFQDRLNKGLPIHGHEIMYPLLQGYDSVVLDVDLEIGGTDQTFNMMMGRHLQRVYNQHEKWVLSTPIINGTDGRKMSKSYGNFVALTDEPNQMYGKLMSITDDMIIEYFTVLTDVADAEIAEMTQQLKSGANPMQLKKRLAHTITTMYHDAQAADEAQAHFEKTIQHKEADTELKLGAEQVPATALELIAIARPDLSKSDLRRLLEQGSVELADQKLTQPHQTISVQAGQILKVGKRHRFVLQLA